jgi:hypothetical protein
MLKVMPDASQADMGEDEHEVERDARRDERAGVSGEP